MKEEWILTKDKYPETRQKVWFTINYGKEVVRGTFVKHFENENGVMENVFKSDDGGSYSPRIHGIMHWKPSPTPKAPKFIEQS